MISNDKLEILKNLIDNSNSIALATHIRPDGDALGSILSFTRALNSIDKKADIIKNSVIPEYLNFLYDKDLYKENDGVYDLFIVLDCSEIDRIGDAQKVFDKANKKVVIDHHVKGGIDGDLRLIYEKSSSTCQLVYEILNYLDVEFTESISSNLFTGICTDTGRFMYENVDKDTHIAAGDLLEKGAKSQEIFKNLYQSKSLNGLQMEIDILSRIKFLKDNKIAFVYISKEDTKKHGMDISDTEYIVNILRDIEGVEVGCVLKEYEDNEYKVSLRSKSYVDVSKIARENNGGGHIKASGYSIFEESCDKAVDKILETLGEIEC